MVNFCALSTAKGMKLRMKKLNSVLIASVILIVGLVAGVAVATIPLLPHSVSQYLGIANTTGYYNIMDYGAQSDRPGFDNAKVINEIIQDMGDNGGTIYIPVGNFYIQSSIEIDRSYISIIGDNSGLRSGVDGSTNTTQSGGGGAKLIVEPGVTAVQILDEENSERISGVSFKSFQIRGQGNNGIGIEAVQDTDRIVIDDLVINNVGIGVQLHGADAPSIRNSWIAETKFSIILNGASQQASIVNNSLGAQPDGVTIELENAKWFNISGNNIYPDGSSNIRLYNPIHGTISSNTISARYNGMIELLPNEFGEYGNGNIINGNVISLIEYRNHPSDKDIEWGILHVEAYNTNINGNQIIADGMPEGYTGILVEYGENNRISNNSIGVTNPSNAKIVVNDTATSTIVTDSIYENEFLNYGNDSNVNVPLPE
ncbi:hypothetical protein SAMN05421736_12551 [Evansella caseinilytica]|uniref:Pectate lyase superfamily protein domain-containing protein n=1 Tax=Evansella caseinilytica TaxID=1503961 RepID=A0A1H3UTI7_9BACI|nr:hypothetical protein SAMN05421736_12551 [Evansella caseinilytica]